MFYSNAALQLFGAIIPKLLGQKQCYFVDENEWDPVEATLDEVSIKMPKINNYILMNLESTKNIGSIILFLEFLSKIEVRKLLFNDDENIFKYNQIFWRLLRHPNEKLRVLAAKCFTLFHEFRLSIPKAIGNIVTILFKISDENFVYGLLQTLIFMCLKYQNDISYIELNGKNILFEKIRDLIRENISDRSTPYSYYIRCKFLEVFCHLDFHLYDPTITNIVFGKGGVTCMTDIYDILNNINNCDDFGFLQWNNSIREIYFSD